MSKSSSSTLRPGFSKSWTKAAPHRIEIGQVYPQEVTLVAWGNAKGALATLDHPGHAALLVRKKREQDMRRVFAAAPEIWPRMIRQKNTYRYFSFFPGSGSDKQYGKSNLQSGKAGFFSFSCFYDMRFEMAESVREGLKNGTNSLREGQYYLGEFEETKDGVDTKELMFGTRADMIVPLPMLPVTSALKFGISAFHMCKDANDFKNSDDFAYFLVSKTQNCAGVAARLLHAGGATAFSSLPTIGYKRKSILYMTPNDVVAYAIATLQGIQQMDTISQYLCPMLLKKSQGVLNNKKYSKDNPFTVYSVSDWKKRSSVHMLSRRGVTSQVDQSLASYHKYDWYKNYPEKLEAACKLFYHIFRFFKLGKSAQRQDAYIMLGLQLIKETRMNIANFTMEPWPSDDHYGRK